MVRLRTPWGLYILSNVVRADVYWAKEGSQYLVFLTLDGYKHVLQRFENENDCSFFCVLMRGAIFGLFDNSPDRERQYELNDLCKSALHELL